MREVIEHTADVGLRVRAATLDGLFAEAGEGCVELIVPNLADVRTSEHLTFELTAASLEDLMCDWLSELLFTFETRGLVLARFDVRIDPATLALRAEARGERLDTNRHRLGYEIKAVTYHQLAVRRTDDGWLAEVIFDI